MFHPYTLQKEPRKCVNQYSIFERISPGTTSISEEGYNALFDHLMDLCNSTFETGLIDLSMVLEMCLDACLYARNCEFPHSVKDDRFYAPSKAVVRQSSCLNYCSNCEFLADKQRIRVNSVLKRDLLASRSDIPPSVGESTAKMIHGSFHLTYSSDIRMFGYGDCWLEHTWQFEIDHKPVIWLSFNSSDFSRL